MNRRYYDTDKDGKHTMGTEQFNSRVKTLSLNKIVIRFDSGHTVSVVAM